ncbi:organic solute transporter subunit beta [Tupaia chinensis]|uniref:Organic solute transporter subunit beta n=1 Tax=Tupaia chinensis TaxID=246437 RepID=L9L8Q5_TUPCH|nr:organic solute transporter subunit beta [Tupaia chinensis]ELW71293.1 Organic solute transporter subunit beta [Tupaia chinensis]
MDHSKEAAGAPVGTAAPQELLEEMVWFFRVEDASPWNYSILALAAVVFVISVVLLGRDIQTNRNRKMQAPRKDAPAAPYQDGAGTKDNSLNHLSETWLSQTPFLAQVEMELKERDDSSVFLSDPPETEN